MAELLLRAVDNININDAFKDRQGCYKRGFPVSVYESPHVWQLKEKPPNFHTLSIPDATKEEVENYINEWRFRIAFEIVGSDPVIDGFRIKATATEFHAVTGEGKITRSMVENFLNNWGASVHSANDNEVVFDVAIYDAIQSEGFWEGLDLTGLIFTEISYDQGTGIHRVEIDYNVVIIPPPYTENRVRFIAALKSKFTNIDHDEIENTVTGDTTRVIVRRDFLNAVRNKTDRMLVRRRYRINSGIMDAIELAGGHLAITKAELLTYIEDLTEE